MSLEGIDVSRWQTITPSLEGRDFLIARACYGALADGTFARHVAAAKAAGVVTGAYLFGRHGRVDDQVATFVRQVRRVGGVELLAVDLEADGLDNPGMTQLEAARAIGGIRFALEQPVGLYHSTSGYPSDALGADWRWVADYRGSEPPIAWDIWQYRGSPLDLDRFDGTRDELVSLGGTMQPAPITDQTPLEVRIPPGATLFDVDGRTVLRTSPGSPQWRPSPYEQGGKRAIFSPGPPIVLVAVGPEDKRPIPTPTPSCDDVVDAALEAAAERAAIAVRARP